MRDYDVIFIVNPNFSETKVNEVREFVRRTTTELGGTVTEEHDWGHRPFPYLVKKFRGGIWTYWKVQLPPTAVARLGFDLRIREGVIRHMISHAVKPSKRNRSRIAKIEARASA